MLREMSVEVIEIINECAIERMEVFRVDANE